MNLIRRKEFMRKKSFGKSFLVLFFIAVLSFGLAGCLTPEITTGTAKLVVSGTYYYNIKMDGTTYHSSKPSGTYYITDIPAGNHTFEAVDIDGPDWGYDSETVYISAGTTTTIYLNPTPTETTGTLQITIANDYYPYYVYMDGNASIGIYLGTTEWGVIDLIDSQGTFTNIPTGYHSFYVISTDYEYDGWGYKTINPGMNYLEIYTY